MKEKQGFRDTMAELNAMFPDKGMLGKGEVAKFMGVSVRTVKRHGIQFGKTTGMVTKADLARQICI